MTDVLVVGAGPTGLMLACELARAGVDFRIVEKSPAPSTKSRALVVHARTLELFDKLGIADELISRGKKTMKASVWVNKTHAADFAIDDTGVDDTPYRFLLFVSQAETEAVLAEKLRASGITIERGVEATSVDPQFGETTLEGGGKRETIKPKFVVGCDGAHSVVRHAAKLSFEGEPYAQDFFLADIRLTTPIDGLEMFFDDRGVFVILPLTNGVYRIIASRSDAPSTTNDPTLADVQALADALAPSPLTLSDPVWLARFRLHHRQAEQYRRGPLFIAGDAAHIHSPAGGQGMNTGIQDAANLAWKLALVVRGGARSTLLDTYNEERHPIGRELLRTTDRMFSLNTTDSAWMKAVRNFTVRHIAQPALTSRAVRSRVFRFLSQLGVGYPQSSIVSGDGAGLRAPDAPARGSSVFALTRGQTHHALIVSRDLPEAESFAARMRGPWLETHAITSPLAGYHDGLTLIRPDGYIGMTSRTLEKTAIDRYRTSLGLGDG